MRFESLASTNTEAARQAERGAPEGLCVVAREQTGGRGRQRRVWQSPKDAGLYFTIILRPRLPAHEWPLLTRMAALAVADALEEACALEEVDIKWPNDIHVRGRKLCGILAECVETSGGRACVVGIGINLSEGALPAELSQTATSLESLGGATDAEALLRAVLRALERRYVELEAKGGALATLRAWTARSSYAEGKRVCVRLDEETFKGITRGLAADGALRVETTGGKIRTVRAGDVSALREEAEENMEGGERD